jgi:hypothetical protein
MQKTMMHLTISEKATLCWRALRPESTEASSVKMKNDKGMILHSWATGSAAGLIAITLLPGLLVNPAFAQAPGEEVGAERWRPALEVYAWAPAVDLEFPDGTNAQIGMKDVISNIDFAFMLLGGVRKGDWLIGMDLIYANLKEDVGGTVGPVLDLKDLEIEAWIAQPFVSYRVVNEDRWTLEVLGSVQYYWEEITQTVQQTIPDFESKDLSGNDSVWNYSVGVRGTIEISQRWYMPYRFDIGTGDSDTIAQALAGFAYRFDSFDLQFGYRYMTWRPANDSELFREQNVYGFYAGALFRF